MIAIFIPKFVKNEKIRVCEEEGFRLVSKIRKNYKTKKEQQETEVYAAALPLSSAVRTGLEPATPCVTGMYSNQLNYRTLFRVYVFFAFGIVVFTIAMQSYNVFLIPPNISAKNAIFFEFFFVVTLEWMRILSVKSE